MPFVTCGWCDKPDTHGDFMYCAMNGLKLMYFCCKECDNSYRKHRWAIEHTPHWIFSRENPSYAKVRNIRYEREQNARMNNAYIITDREKHAWRAFKKMMPLYPKSQKPLNPQQIETRDRVTWFAFRMMEARELRQYRKKLKGYKPDHVSTYKPKRRRIVVTEVPVRSIPEDKIKCYLKEARAMLTGRKIGINKCTLLPGDPGYEEQVKE